ncbi:MAG: outer membrane beta-barrel protein [Myxococcota bacterium]|nr:outer membrane beta-barrel protein [Myxococcota bacterium]
MKRIALLVSVLVLQFSVSGLIFAADAPKPGLYLQGAFTGQADTFSDVGESRDSGKTAYGGSFAVGYFITKWLAVQGRVGVISNPIDLYNVDFTGWQCGVGNSTCSSWQLQYTAGVKIYPLSLLTQNASGLFQPYAIGALGGQTQFIRTDNLPPGVNVWTTSSSTYFLLELGGGLDLMLTRNFGFFGEVTYDYLNFSSSSYLGIPIESSERRDWSGNGVGWQVGVTYRF